ncbi:MAG: High-affnity carbon uptake protein Hat/HatR [Cyclobacteriaceae bacterium]|nr:High-affnity carbon uptake protein Hat/HatR [Cyclobacteriaceae bacterium]
MSTITSHIENPFPGLRPFNIDESHLFFGREGQTDEVLLKLSQHRFVGIIGPSGSGKSSFIYCGALPILYGGFLTETGPNWEVVVTRPGNNPIENLGEAILEHDPAYDKANYEDRKIKRTIISTLMKSSSLGLVEAIQQTRKQTGKNYLILVDQFEELFRFKDDSLNTDSVNETLSFINLLMEAINYKDEPIYIAITMRSDFIGECAQFAELTRKINDSHYLIPMLTREQKRRAIEGPVAVGSGEITPRLVQKLLNDLGDNPDQLPILQHALMRTWDYWKNNKETDSEEMDLKHYEAIGTMEEALSMHANEAFDELNDYQREICAILFKAITEKRGESFGIRRPTLLSEIASIADVSVEEVSSVIERFREPGRSLLMPPADQILHADSMIDISHESLMRIWVRLKNWVDEESEAVSMYLRLSEASAMHQVGKGGLWRPPDLQLALNWQLKHKPTLVWGQRYDLAYERTMVFLEYSKKEFEEEQKIKELQAKRALKRARMTALIMGAATVISLFFLLFAFVQKTAAEKSEKLALEESVRANANEKKANENLIEANRQKAAADIARDKADESAIAAQKAEQVAIDEKAVAVKATGRAQRAEANAKDKELIAIEKGEEARKAEAKAQKEKENADKLRYLALSKALAIKATKNIPDSQLKGLLARQGYNFNVQHAGPSFNSDIYDGVYKALAQFGDISTKSLKGHSQQVNVVINNGSSDQGIFSADSEGKILQWSVKNGQVSADTIVGARLGYNTKDLTGDPNGDWLIASGDYPSADGSTFIDYFNLANNATRRLEGFKGVIQNTVLLPSKNEFLALQENGRDIVKYSFSTNAVSAFIMPSVKVNHLALSANGKLLVGGGNDGKVFIWDLSNGNKERVIYETKGDAITSVRFSPNGRYLVAGNREGLVTIIEPVTGAVVRRFSEIQAQINDVEFSPNGKFLAVASLDGTLRVWNMDELKLQPLVLSGYTDWAAALDFTTDGEFLLGGGFANGEVRVWPIDITQMAEKLCTHINRSMTNEEWEIYVADLKDIAKENTCKNVQN